MKKLSIEKLESTVGGVRTRTCFLAGIFTSVSVGVGILSGGITAGIGALAFNLSAANYNGCFS